MMMIAAFYQILLVIVDPIFLGGFKMGNDFLDQLGMGSIFIGHRAVGDLIL